MIITKTRKMVIEISEDEFNEMLSNIFWDDEIDEINAIKNNPAEYFEEYDFDDLLYEHADVIKLISDDTTTEVKR